MMHLARFAGLHHQPGLHAQALADQMMMHRRRSPAAPASRCAPATRRGPTGSGCCCRPAPRWSLRCRCARPRAPAPRAFGRVPGDVDRRGAEGAVEQRLDARIFSRSALVSTGCETSSRLCVPAWRPSRFGRGPIIETSDITSSSRIGSIGGLVTCAKVLLEIIVEQLGLAREHRQRRVGAHRADRIVARPPPSARGRTGCLPGCSRTPAGDRAGPPHRSSAALLFSAGRSSSSLNWVCFSHSS